MLRSYAKSLSILTIMAEILLLLMLATTVQASEEVNASPKSLPRIGSGIDAVEKKYFGLFPKIFRFDSAKVVTSADGGLVFYVAHRTEFIPAETTFTLGAAAASELECFLEDFEVDLAQRVDAPFQFIDSTIATRPRRKFTSREAVVVKLNGERMYGQLLCATDTHVILWNSPTAYDWRKAEHESQLLCYADIDRVRVRGKHTFFTGASAGFLFGFVFGTIARKGPPDHMFPIENERRWEGVVFGLGAALVGGVMGTMSHTGEVFRFHRHHEAHEKTAEALSQRAAMWATPPPELHAKEAAKLGDLGQTR